MASEKIKITENGAVASLALHRPERQNAADGEMMDAIGEALARLQRARILILSGSGEHFCAGRDPGPVLPKTAIEWSGVLQQIVRTNEALASFPGVTIALVRGKAHGFGFGLAIQSDITLAADDASFGFPEIQSGFPPTIVMSYLSRWTARKKAFELVITGEPIGAAEAAELGLVNRIVPRQELAAESERWVARLLKLDEQALRACKAYFRDTAYLDADHAYRYGISFLANFNSSRKS
jgi:enoyl-CoA hydratase/carnithine racemase